jgi:hypothetical protein
MHAKTLAFVLMLTATPAFAGGGHNGGHNSGGHAGGHQHGGHATKSSSKPTIATGQWSVTEFVDDFNRPSYTGYHFGQMDMNRKGKFSGWTYGQEPGSKVSIKGKINTRNLAVTAKTGDGYKAFGHYEPPPPEGDWGFAFISGGMFGKNNISTGNFHASGPTQGEDPSQ